MIYIVWGHPGEGKTYYCTLQAIQGLREGKTVFSNYPIFWNGKSSFKWKPEYASLSNPPTNAIIVIDEAYRDYNSRKFQSFTTEEHTYFATNRHNNLEIYLIAQNPARLDVAIREISQFILMKKYSIFGFIIGFKAEFFEFLEDLSQRKKGAKDAHYHQEFCLFRKYIANAYDTHFWGKKNSEPFIGEPWTLPDHHDNPEQPGQKHISKEDSKNDLEELFEEKPKKLGYFEFCTMFYGSMLKRLLRVILSPFRKTTAN